MASVTGSTCFGTECPTLGAKTEGQNLARSVRNDRPGKGAGTPERNQLCSMKPNRTVVVSAAV